MRKPTERAFKVNSYKEVFIMLKNDTEVFSGEEILDKIYNGLDEYDCEYFDDFFNDLFNADYYIIGTYQAAEELKKFENDETLDGYETYLNGVFGAIELVQDYEKDCFDNVNTDLGDPEKVANMVEYIRGENVLNMVLDKVHLSYDDEFNEENRKKVKKAIEEVEKEGF